MLHFCRVYAYWPDKQGKSAWEKLDAHGPHEIYHDEARDLHRVLRNTRFRPYWTQAEEKEWQGLWERGVFKKWSRRTC